MFFEMDRAAGASPAPIVAGSHEIKVTEVAGDVMLRLADWPLALTGEAQTVRDTHFMAAL